MANSYESEMDRSDRRAERMAVSVSIVLLLVAAVVFNVAAVQIILFFLVYVEG